MVESIKIKYSQTLQGKAALHRADCRRRQTKKFKLSQKRYWQSEKGKATQRAAQKRYFIRYPECYKARYATNNAITAGKLPRPDTLQCHYCPKPAKEYHHYLGYEAKHALDVVPACKTCHQKKSQKKIKELDVA